MIRFNKQGISDVTIALILILFLIVVFVTLFFGQAENFLGLLK